MDLEEFQHSLIVRNITQSDIPRLIELEGQCFPGMTVWTAEQLEAHLRIFPEGQFCIEYNGKLVASASSHVLDLDLYDEKHTWNAVTDNGWLTNHDPDGDTLYGVEIMIDPEFRGRRLARRLYEARKELVRRKNLVRIVLGGRIPGYHRYKQEMSAMNYVEKVQRKELYDPVLTAQISNGFVVKRLLREYVRSDVESDGYATFLEWTNLEYRPIGRQTMHSRRVRICALQYMMREIDSFDAFLKQCEYFIDVAAGYRSDFVLFPELLTLQLLSFLPEERPGLAARRLSEFTGPYIDAFQALAIKYNVNIIGGSHFIVEDGHLYNVTFFFTRDGKVHKQYKLHITPSERTWWGVEPGNRVEVIDTDRGLINLQICYDVEFPEISRYAVDKGARIIFVPFCTDERHGYLRVRYCAQARAIENQVFVAMAGTVGNLPNVENMDIQYAQSAILTPSDFTFARDGIAAECSPNVETVVVHDVDLENLNRSRRSGTTRNWRDRRTDLYSVEFREQTETSL